MTYKWQYPVFVLPIGGGLASVVESAPTDQPVHALAVFTDAGTATAFAVTCGLTSVPRPIQNAHQFAWLLQSLRPPVTRTAFDPTPDGQELQAAWIVAVTDLLAHPLLAARSPWIYPVFAVIQPTGFASIAGSATDGEELTAVCLFTSRDRADAYLEQLTESGEIQALENADAVRALLSAIGAEVGAIALNPSVVDGHHSTEHCVSIAALLEKYLAAE